MHTIIGAGSIGTLVARALVEKGEDVRMLSRRGAASVEGVDARAVDVRDAEALRSAVAGSRVVYQCAQPEYHRWVAEFPSLQEAVVDAAAAAGADLVLIENLYPYGEPIGAPLSEASPELPTTRKGRLRKRMADAALAAHRAGRLRVTAVRPSNYFGPGYDLTGRDLFAAAATGTPMRVLGRLDQPHSLSFTPDVARAMIALAESETAWGRPWIAPVQPPLTQRQFAQRIWTAAGRDGEPTVRTISKGMVRLAGVFSPTIREVGEMMYEFERPFEVDSSAIERSFGVAPTPLDDAVAETLGWYSPVVTH